MIVNETKVDLLFNTSVGMRIARRTRVILAIAAVVVLACGGLILGLTIADPEDSDYFLPILFLALGVFFGVLALGYKPFMRRVLQKNMQGKESVQRYTFTEEGYEQIATLNDGTESRTQGGYAAITECREYSDMWLLYLNKTTIFGVSKGGMKEGTAEELTALFMRAFGPRYKTCFKRK